MAAHASNCKIYPADIGYFVNKLRNIALVGNKYSYKSEMPINGGVTVALSHGMSLSSWGENIRINLVVQGNQTVVDIFSECAMPTQLIDMGKNKENVRFLFAYLEQGMPASPYYGNPGQPVR